MFDKRLMLLCPESKKYILGNILLQFLELCLNAAMIVTIALSVQRFYEGTWNLQNLTLPMLIILCTVILRFFTTRYAVRMSYLASRTVKRVMREKIYGKLLRLGTAYREHVTTAELVQEAVEGVDQLESYFGQYVPQFFYAFMAPIALFFLFGFGGSWKVAAVLLICVPLIPGAIMMVQKIAKRILAKYWGQYTQLCSAFLENLQGMTTLKTYQADEYKNEEMNKESEHFRKVTMAVLTMQLNSVTIMDFVGFDGFLIPLLALMSSFGPVTALASLGTTLQATVASGARVLAVLDEQPETEDITGQEEIDFRGAEVKDLSFSYGREAVLEDLTLSFPEGKIIGIVGKSGCGKSTLLKLLMRFWRVQKGQVSISARSVESINTQNLREMESYMTQETQLFKDTIAGNLRVAKLDATDEELRRACQKASIHDFILTLPKGYDTPVGELGDTLSGGERQRIGLARAFLHDAPFLLLDEPTSNLDSLNEAVILKSLKEEAKGKTVVLVSHRATTVRIADAIIEMENGRVS